VGETHVTAGPFIKWAGGKAKLAAQIAALMPETSGVYIEPLLGGGAVFWHLVATRRWFIGHALSDADWELVNLYHWVSADPNGLARAACAWPDDADTYSEVRAARPDVASLEAAAQMLYLNHRCFNGLYRVNKGDGFNVPRGKYKHTRLDNADRLEADLEACATVLQRDGVRVRHWDYEDAIHRAGPRDVVYADPPYVPVNQTSNFVSYTAGGFGLDAQTTLANALASACNRGAFVIAGNADVPLAVSLYEDRGFEIHRVEVRRNINSKKSGRGPVGEILAVGCPR